MKQQDWVLTRKRLLRRIKAEVSDRLGEPSASFRQYAEKLNAEFRGRWRACDWDDLLKAVGGADIAFASDFHAHMQSQRAHLRILRALPEDRPIVMALECVCSDDQAVIDAYLDSELTEEEFLESVAWTKVWGFPWAHYRPVFELARARGFRICGLSRRSDLESELPLESRDGRMANDIVQLMDEHPTALVYVMVGELHLAVAHLPDAFRQLRPRANSVLVYQDAESLYFRLARSARDQSVDVLRSGRRFCVMVSPPWVKWQSYLMFLEATCDRELDDDGSSIDYTDHVRQLVELLSRDFDVKIDTNSIHVYTPASHDVLKQMRKNLGRELWPVLQAQLENDRGFLLPEKGLIYLASPTLNRAAHLAGEFLHARLSHREGVVWDGAAHWESSIWIEGMAFFFSKWINPKRKARELALLSPRDGGRAALQLALDQRMSEIVWLRSGRKRSLRAFPRRRIDILEAARILGSLLGDRMFLAVRAGEVSAEQVVEWAQAPVAGADFGDFYRRLLKRLGT